METLGLACPVRTWPAKARRGCEHDRPGVAAIDRDLLRLHGRALVDVSSENDLGTSSRKPLDDAVASAERALPCRPPRRVREMMVQRDDAKSPRFRCRELPVDMLERSFVEPSALVAPRSGRAQTDNYEAGRPIDRSHGTERILVPRPRP
jgi:hypothetical protein